MTKETKIKDKIKILTILITLVMILIIKLTFSLFSEKEYLLEIKSFYTDRYISKENSSINNKKIKQIIENGVIATNYYMDKEGNIIGDSERILSESQGLMLEYSIYTQDKELFDKSYNFLKDKMLLENNLFSWDYSSKDRKKSKANATIDDLRIFRNLVYANTLWGGYEEEIIKIEKGIRKLYTNGYLVDFSENGEIGKDVSVFYIDAVAIKMLEEMNPLYYKGFRKKQKKLIEKARINKELPFYYEKYMPKKLGGKLEKIETINTLYSLITIYNKKLLGENIDSEESYLEKLLERDDAIYSQYKLDGSVATKVESTAIYSYLKMISELQGDKEFTEKIDRKIEMLTRNEGIPVSYDELNNGLIYSFDLLTFLIAQNRGK